MTVDLNRLNPAQRSAVEHAEGPILVLAGAGSGKTRVITYRTAHLLDRGVLPEQILVMTFTNKAASEMRQRVVEMVGPEQGKELTLSTFHAFGARMLRKFIKHLGYGPNFTILDETDRNRLLKSALDEIGLKRTGVKTDQIIRWISQAKQKQTNPAGLREARYSPLLPHAQRVFSAYQAGLKALNAVDFDDLLLLPLQLLRDVDAVRQVIQDRFQYVMVDEYQDTNGIQLDLLRAVAGSGNLMAVGDDDQSIYAFRGAVASNILEFEKHFPGTRTVTLDQNYRSTSHILNAANAVIANNTTRHAKRLWSAAGDGQRVRFVSCANEREEASFVAAQIVEQHGDDGVAYEHFAILYRVNPQAKLFEEALRARGIPYRVLGGTALFDRAEVRDWAAYLRLLVNPDDELSLRRVINVPRRGIGTSAVQHLDRVSKARGISLMEATRRASEIDELSPPAKTGTAQLVALLSEFRGQIHGLKGGALVEPCHRYFQATGLAAFIRRSEKNAALGQRRVESVTQLIEGMAEYREDTLASYLMTLTLDNRNIAANSKDARGVTLLTLHSSKGLEYPRVFLVGFEKDFLPHKRSADRPSAIAEERRLCYVGMTRAMRRLTLTAARTRLRGSERLPRRVSSFFEEIPEELVERVSVGGAVSETQKARNDAYFARIKAMLGE